MNVNKKDQRLCPSWDNLPTDVLLIIFEYIPTSSLAVCLYVSQTWRNHVEHVLEVKNKWEELCEMNFNISEFKIKCKKTLDLPQMYYNYMLWHSFQKANIKLHHMREANGIKKINIYRDNLIVVTDENIQHYDAKTLLKQPTGLELSSCEDFFENDVMAAEVYKDDKFLKLVLLIKNESTDYRTERNVVMVDNVICYKIHNDECHVLDHRNVHSVYTIIYNDTDRTWRKETLGRYYGNPADSCAVNVFDKQFYLMLKGGFILWMDQNNGHYKKMTLVSLIKKSHKNNWKIQQICESTQVIYRKMYVWCCMHDIRVSSRTIESAKTSLCIDRAALWSNPMNESIIFPYIVRNVSCMHQHGDILFLGHFDGTVELISSKDISRNLSKTEPLRRFNIKDFKDDIADLAVISIDVSEYEDLQYMFIATSTCIFHLRITYKNSDSYNYVE